MTEEPLDAIEELLPAYALNALDDNDRARVERALEREPRYWDRLADYLAAASELVALHSPVQPPVWLGARLLANIPPNPPAPVPVTERAPEALAPARKDDRYRLLWGAAAALVLALAGLASFSFVQHQQLQGLRDQVATLQATTADADQRLAAAQALALWEAQPNLSTVPMHLGISPVDFQAAMPSQSDPPTGMLMLATNGEAVLVVDNLGRLPDYYSYQAWVWDWSGNPHSLGVFETDGNGYAQVPVDFPQNALPFQLLSVSVEPAGGSVTPSGASVLTGTAYSP